MIFAISVSSKHVCSSKSTSNSYRNRTSILFTIKQARALAQLDASSRLDHAYFHNRASILCSHFRIHCLISLCLAVRTLFRALSPNKDPNLVKDGSSFTRTALISVELFPWSTLRRGIFPSFFPNHLF